MAGDPYRRIAGWYDRLFDPLQSGLRSVGMKLAPPAPGKRVLDVGCGTGAQLKLYAKAGCDCTGIDTSPSMLERARHNLGDTADLELGDATAMPYATGTFDLALITTVLHELPAELRVPVLLETARTIDDDGRILVVEFGAGPFDGVRGKFLRGFSTVIERFAGRDHFRGYRSFVAAGGLRPLVQQSGLTVDQSRVVAAGNVELWLLRGS